MAHTLPMDPLDLAAEIEGAAATLNRLAEDLRREAYRRETTLPAAAVTASIKTSIVFDDLQKVIANSLRPTVVPAFEAGPRRTLSDVLGADVVAMAMAAGDEERA